MFSNEPVNNTSSILMCLKEFDDTLEAEELLSNNCLQAQQYAMEKYANIQLLAMGKLC